MNTLGKQGEDIAISYLRKKGYGIIEKNFRTIFGEIDIIAKDKHAVVFVEVKARSDIAFGYPFEAVHSRKREKIKKVALSYMKRFKKGMPARFDVLSIYFEHGKQHIEHIQDAFEV